MRISTVFLYPLLLAAVFLVAGCTSSPSTRVAEDLDQQHEQRLEQIQLEELNSIGLEGVELQLPEEWHFFAPQGAGTDLDLFHFSDESGKISGRLSVEVMTDATDLESYTRYYFEQKPGNYNLEDSSILQLGYQTCNLSVLRVSDSQRAVHQAVYSIETEIPNNIFFTLWIEDSPERTLTEETFLEICSSFATCDPSFEKRIRKNSFMFRNFNQDTWKWVSDYHDGFLLRFQNQESLILAGIWSEDEKNAVHPLPPDEELKSFSYSAFVENQPVTLKGKYWLSEDNMVHALVPVTSRIRKYQMYLGSPGGESEFLDFIQMDNLKELLGFHLLFPRQ